MTRIVIIGASITGHTVATELARRAPECAITLVTEESYPLYDRRRILDFLDGRVKEKELLRVRADEYEKSGIVFMPGHKVSSVNAGRGIIYFREKGTLGFDILVAASGRKYAIPEIPGAKKENVFALNTLDDVKSLRGALITDAVCIAGNDGIAVSAAALCGSKYKTGVKLIIGRGTAHPPVDFGVTPEGIEVVSGEIAEIIGEGTVQAVKLKEGKAIGVSAVIFMGEAFVSPDYLKNTPVEMSGGRIMVDARMRTNMERIYACGSVACIRDAGFPAKSWEECRAQGETAAESITRELESACPTS